MENEVGVSAGDEDRVAGQADEDGADFREWA